MEGDSGRIEEDNCRACGEMLSTEHLIVTECDDILCASCFSHHECDICGTEPTDDSSYEPSETSETSEDSDDE